MRLRWDFRRHEDKVPVALVVHKEPGDARLKGGEFGTAESALLGRIRRTLNDAAALADPRRNARREGPWICKRMSADGHMVDERQRYLRMRTDRRGVLLAVYSGSYAIEDAGERLQSTGTFRFNVADIGVRS
jgi:hypothetical protein